MTPPPDWRWEKFRSPRWMRKLSSARMDLVFSLAERFNSTGTPGGIDGMVEFRTDVFDAASVESLIERLQRVLVVLTADTAQCLSAVDVLDAADRARLDEIGHRSVLARSVVESSIPELFAAQVNRAPDSVAVSFDGRSLSYRELDEASNRLAHLLVSDGAGPGACVGLMTGRSVGAVVAILGVLKSGAAYLPIDPVVPDARVEFMLGDAGPCGGDRPRAIGRAASAAVVCAVIDHRGYAAARRLGPVHPAAGRSRCRRCRPHHLHVGDDGCAEGRCGHSSRT